MISGLASTIFASGVLPFDTSITVIRCPNPICGAARPTPEAAYIDSNMSSTSFCKSSSNFSTRLVGVSKTGSPNFTIG